MQAGRIGNVAFMFRTPPVRQILRPALAVAAIALAIAGLTGCGDDEAETDSEDLSDVTVALGHVERPESRLIAEIYSQALVANGAEVELVGLKSEDAGLEQAAAGDIDLYPDETGRIFTALAGGASRDVPPAPEVDGAIASALSERGLVGLMPAPADDDTRVACATTIALDLNLRTLSDLAPVADQLTYAASAAHAVDPIGLGGLRRTYGIDFGTVVTVPAGGGYLQIERGLANCTHGLGTDPQLAAAALTVLGDDLGTFQPLRFQPLPVANADFIASAPDAVRTTLDAASAGLTEPELRRLRARVEIERVPVTEVVAAHLR